jgi:2-methylcitrate dehydratase PrpD
MLDGRLSFDASHDAARMQNPDVQAMGRRIRLLGPTPGLERFAAEVEVVAAGQTFHAEQDRNVLGRYENPMTRLQVEEKALELMATVIPESRAREAIALVAEIETVPDTRTLIRLLSAP